MDVVKDLVAVAAGEFIAVVVVVGLGWDVDEAATLQAVNATRMNESTIAIK